MDSLNYKANRLGRQLRDIWLPVVRNALVGSVVSKAKSPPGSLADASAVARRDRGYLERLSIQHGSVFRTVIDDELVYCVVGLALGRKLLREHRDQLRPVTIDISPVAESGFMRQMQGEAHTRYRRAVQDALANNSWRDTTAFRDTVDIALRNYSEKADFSPDSWLDALTSAATAILIELLFGEPVGTQNHAHLHQEFLSLGPYGMVWNLEGEQFAAYERLAALVVKQDSHTGIIGHLRSVQTLDQDLLANLIFMVEIGRYDLRAFFRWLSNHATTEPAMLEAINSSSDSAANSTAESLVLETLRMDQSERLMRHCLEDIEIEGLRIPKGATVRICMWESHHSAAVFDEPMRFRANRFSSHQPAGDAFSPFGLDHHQCPFSAPVVRIGTQFVRALAHYQVTAHGDGKEIRGGYHWEPPTGFYVALEQRP